MPFRPEQNRRDQNRYGQLDEATLLARLQTGDEALFRDVVGQLTPTLLRLARSYTQTASAAQDAVQDTWLTVLEKLDSFEGRSTLKTWVCGILVNVARRSGVREARTLPFSSAWRDDRGPAVDPGRFHSRRDDATTGSWASPPVRWDQLPEDRLAATELRRVLDAAIAGLPLRHREVLTARDVVGMDAAEAASVLGLSLANQRVLLHRARSRVRAALELYAGDLPDAAPPDGPGSSRRRSAPPGDAGRPAPSEFAAVSVEGQVPVMRRPPRRSRSVACRELVELVTDYLEADLDLARRAAVEGHLAVCGHCASYLQQVRRMLELTADSAPEPLPDELLDALLGVPVPPPKADP